MITCEICDKVFKRRDNKLRHMRTVHTDDIGNEEEEEGDMSDSTDDPETNDSNDISLTSESQDTTEEELDRWNEIVGQAFDEWQSDYENKVNDLMESEDIDQKTARNKAFGELRSLYRKGIAHKFVEKIIWYNVIKWDRIFKVIKKTTYWDDILHQRSITHEKWTRMMRKIKTKRSLRWTRMMMKITTKSSFWVVDWRDLFYLFASSR